MSKVTEHVGNIFDAPDGSILMHACNCLGNWGGGVARAFADNYPAAYEVHHTYCQTPPTQAHKRSLVGTAQLIPPQAADGGRKHWIANLFTSYAFGLHVDSPEEILAATQTALADLKAKIAEAEKDEGVPAGLAERIYTIRINSARFGVPWAETLEQLEASGLRVRVLNNVAVMPGMEKRAVLEDLQKRGWSTDPVTFDEDGNPKA